MSAKRDAISNASPAQSISPQAVAADLTGTGVEVRGFEEVGIEINAGVCTDGDYTILVEESDDNSTYTTVAAGDIDGTGPTIAAANDDQIFKLGYMGNSRYIRTSVVEGTDGSTGVVIAVTIQRRRPHNAPV